MGFNEDDRIRSKNKLHNEAYEEYLKLKSQGYTDEDVTYYCQTQLDNTSTNTRNEMYSTIMKIVGSSYEGKTSS